MLNQINLELFPAEILLEIVRLVPVRWNLSLVSLKFYEIVCDIERNKFCLTINDVSSIWF